MTNVRRPVHLPLQRPSLTMVSSSSGPSPFGVVAGESGPGAGGVSGVSPMAQILGASVAGAQQSPGQPASRATPIRPNALINFNCITQTPSIPNNLASPMQALMMSSASSSSSLSPRSSRAMNIGGGPERPTCCPATRSGAAGGPPGDHAIPALNHLPCHNRHHYHHHTKALSPSGLNDSLPSQIMPHLFVGNQEQTNRETVNKLNIKYILSLGLLPMIIANGGSNSVTTLSPTSPAVAAINKKGASSKSKSHHNHQHNHHHHHHHHHHHQLQQPQHLMPGPNLSRDFKIRIRSNTPTTPTTPNNTTNLSTSTTNTTVTQQEAVSAPVETSLSAASSNQNNYSSTATTTTANTTNTTLIPTKARDENKGIKQVRSVYCKCINIADNSDQLLDKFFEEAYMFIDEARRKKCNILIHCLAGISRSPTIAIAYLMRVRSLHWKDAYDLVKQCRPQIDPNLNFMGQLRIYNKSLRDEHRPAAIASSKRNNSGINDSLIADDCRNAIKNGKQNCCIDHNNSNTLLGHESTNVTANLRDKDNN